MLLKTGFCLKLYTGDGILWRFERKLNRSIGVILLSKGWWSSNDREWWKLKPVLVSELRVMGGGKSYSLTPKEVNP
jgi:hypothetical protein